MIARLSRVAKQILNSNKDPFNRAPLKEEDLVPNDELKQRILSGEHWLPADISADGRGPAWQAASAPQPPHAPTPAALLLGAAAGLPAAARTPLEHELHALRAAAVDCSGQHGAPSLAL